MRLTVAHCKGFDDWWVCKDEAGEVRTVDLALHSKKALAAKLRHMKTPFKVEVERLIPYRELAVGVRVVKEKKGK